MCSEARIDLHLHSHASGRASNWWMSGLGEEVQESYTPPKQAYGKAKDAGMDFVTLTDHETIDGALTLTGHPDFLVGEEVCAVFPEDGYQADILVYGIDAEAHREAQARRGNIYELVEYLRESQTVHVLAHPIYGVPIPLDRAQVEKRLALFGLWEFVNGSRPATQNRLARRIAEGVGPAELRDLAARHGLPSPPHRRIAGTGGSDDHGGLYPGATFTTLPEVKTPQEVLEAMAAGETQPGGEHGSVSKLTHSGMRIAGTAYRKGEGNVAGSLFRLAPGSGLLGRFLPPGNGTDSYLPLLSRLDEPQIRQHLTGLHERKLASALAPVRSGLPVADVLSSAREFLEAHMPIAPYLGVHGYFGRESRAARTLGRDFNVGEPPKIGMFVDGLEGVHGVATMYRNLEAANAGRGEVRLIHCGDDGESLQAVGRLPVPLYDGMNLAVPSLLDVLDHVAEQEYTALHVAAPGPLGLAALIAGLVTGTPVVGAYHTEFGAYARLLSGDEMAGELVEVAVREFYERCRVVAVPSKATALSLRNRGYRIQSFEILKNGVDTDLFNPGRRDTDLHGRLGGGRTLLLYAGRVSREKNLDLLAHRYTELRRRRDDLHLVIAGDGPGRPRLEEQLGDLATFTGFLQGEELAATFASSDIFVFPSLTDTLGRAVIEAQACGLPAVVWDSGGPAECLLPGRSGFAVEPGDEERFFSRIELLADDPKLRERMGREAANLAARMGWETVLDDLLAMHARAAGATGPAASPLRG